MNEQDPRRQTRRYTEERIAELRRELVVGEACAGTVPDIWEAVEEELLDELAELELFLLTGESGSHVRLMLSSPRRQGR